MASSQLVNDGLWELVSPTAATTTITTGARYGAAA
jgi:hypothetical protein